MERLTESVRGVVKLALFLLLILAIAGTVVEFLVPKDQLRALSIQNLQQRLRRQVKMTSISIGPWRGLRVEGLEISEAPDFSAGTLLEVKRLTVKPKFLPLLMGRIAIGEVTLTDPRFRVVRLPGGRFNFTGLLESEKAVQGEGGLPPLPPAAPRAKPAAPAAAPDETKALLADPLAPALKDAPGPKVAESPSPVGPGSPGPSPGQAAPPAGLPPLKPLGDLGGPKKNDLMTLLTTGWDDPPKKLAELGALAAGAAAEAATRVKVDIERLRIRRGTLDYVDGENGIRLAATGVSIWAEGLTPRSTRTDVSIDGKLEGKIQDQPTEMEFSLEARMELDKNYYPVVTAGFLVLNKIRHPSFVTERVRAEWDLQGVSPDLTTAKGVVRLDGSPGDINRPAYLARQGKWPGLLLYPIEVLAKFRGLGLPDLLKIPYNELRGEYSFQNGSINLAPLYIRGPVVSINAEGVLNLVQRTVGLKANVIMGKSSIGVLIRGPMDAPKVEGDVSFKGPKRKHRTVEQEVGAGALLDQAFGSNPDALVPDEPPEQRAARKAGLKRTPKDLNRTHTIKDAERIIDQPLPED
ncbi:MAG: AsmA family protein [Elusimicrobia bacterium]|nr:AsmA family protein [Elusimicrobiota bacterium]